MRIAFLQYDLRFRVGIGILSALLKKNGHITAVFTSFDKDLINDIIKFNPDILGLSSSTTEHNYLYQVAEEVKNVKKDLLVVLGGPHATFFPEEIFKRDIIDIICRGEGDEAIVELANRLENNENYFNIKNLWVKKGNNVITNEIRPLIEQLDDLPFPDREIYYNKYPELKNNPTKLFLLGRGCPFNCTYCFNHQMRKLYKDKGEYVRMPSVDYAIRQIKEVQDKFGFKWVQIVDDTINAKKAWIEEFLVRYKKEIGVPFLVNIRIDLMDEDLALKFIEAGIDRVDFGIEHGNEKFRREVLNRNYKNEHVIKIARFLKEHNVRISTTNMVGFPGETLDLAFETVELNRKIKPDISTCFILIPFPKTDIYNYCLERNLLKENVTIDNLPVAMLYWYHAKKYAHSVVKLERENELINFHKLFDLLVKYESLEPAIRVLMKLPPNNFFNFISVLPKISQKVRYSLSREEKIKNIKVYTNAFNLDINYNDYWIEFFDKKIIAERDLIPILMLLSYELLDKNQ
ncbi:MAG: B12-binding domain-containing radical SAM protein [Promethearchaeota archaeon]